MYSVFETYIEEYIQIVKKKDWDEKVNEQVADDVEYICLPTNGRNSQRWPSETKSAKKVIRVLPIQE